MASSVQPAFSFRSAGVSGELHRRNQPALKPKASDRPALRKFAGSTCHISLLPAASSLLPLCFARVTPISSRRRRFKPPPLHIAALHRRALAHAAAHRHGRQPPFQAAAARPRARPAPPVRACAARARLRAPAPPARASIAKCRRASTPPSIHAAAAVSTPPSIHAVHAAAAADHCSPSAR